MCYDQSEYVYVWPNLVWNDPLEGIKFFVDPIPMLIHDHFSTFLNIAR